MILCFSVFQSAVAFVTFFNHSGDDSLVVTYQLCTPAGPCSASYNTIAIPPLTTYKDKDIVLNDNQNDKNDYFQLFVISVEVTLPDKSTFTKLIPAKQYPNGLSTTPCYAYQNTGVMFDTFNAQSELFCASGSG